MANVLRRKWIDLKEICTILQIPYKATIALQKHDLTLSDSFGIWLKMEIHLNSGTVKRLSRTNFGSCLIHSLNQRKQCIFNNPAMLCAIYLDPRYRGEISNDENLVGQATQMLANLWRRLNIFRPELANKSAINLSTESSGVNLSIDFDDQKILNEYLSRADHSRDEPTSDYRNFSIEHEIELFRPEKLSADASVISFWDSSKERNKHLHELAMVVYAIPPAETQIERDFSLLEFIFSQRRQNLCSETLEAILTINLNSEIFYDIKKEKLLKTFE